MAQSDLADINDEIVWELRNNITDPESRPTPGTYNTTASAGQTVFTINVAGINNIKTVTVDGNSKDFGFDYSVSLGNTSSTVTLVVGASLDDPVVITYDRGTNWIYGDLPRTDIKLGSFPRIGINDVSSVMTEFALGATLTKHSLLKSITICALDAKRASDLMTDVKNFLLSNKKNFYNFQLVVPVGISPVIIFNTIISDKGKLVETVQQTMTVSIPYVWEETS